MTQLSLGSKQRGRCSPFLPASLISCGMETTGSAHSCPLSLSKKRILKPSHSVLLHVPLWAGQGLVALKHFEYVRLKPEAGRLIVPEMTSGEGNYKRGFPSQGLTYLTIVPPMKKKSTTHSISLSFLSPVYLASDLLHLLFFIPPAFSIGYRTPVRLLGKGRLLGVSQNEFFRGQPIAFSCSNSAMAEMFICLCHQGWVPSRPLRVTSI